MKTVELGNVALIVLAVFIVAWGLVHGLWAAGWPIAAVVAAVAIFKKPR